MEYYFYSILKLIIGFSVIIFYLNISGKTQLSQMTSIDLVGNFIMGGIIGGVIYSDTIAMEKYILILFIGVFLIYALNMVSRKCNFARSIAIGDSIPIIKNGKFIMRNITNKENKIDILNITSLLHAQGIQSFQQVAFAQIEPNGQLTAICDDKKTPSLILMKNGAPRQSALEEIEKDAQWLTQTIEQENIQSEDIFIVELWNQTLYITLCDGSCRSTKVQLK